MKTLSQVIRSTDRDFNPGLPEYETGLVTKHGHDARLPSHVSECKNILRTGLRIQRKFEKYFF